MSEQKRCLKDSSCRCFRLAGVAPGDLFPLMPDKEALALVYTPQRCVFARVDNDALTHPDLDEIDPAEAFEIRFFNAEWELRWRREGEKGTAILWAQDYGNFDGEEVKKQPAKERNTRYLLWGKVIKPPQNGWVTVGTHQVGTLQVPFPGKATEGDHLALRAVEYFAKFDDGNIAFIGERLAGLTAISSGGGAK